jgi:hypothetical protein
MTDQIAADRNPSGEGPNLPEIPLAAEPCSRRPTWREERAARNRRRHLYCATRSGPRLVEGSDGPILIESS